MDFCDILDALVQESQEDTKNSDTFRQKIEKLIEIELKFTTGLTELKDHNEKKDEKVGENELEVTQARESGKGKITPKKQKTLVDAIPNLKKNIPATLPGIGMLYELKGSNFLRWMMDFTFSV